MKRSLLMKLIRGAGWSWNRHNPRGPAIVAVGFNPSDYSLLREAARFHNWEPHLASGCEQARELASSLLAPVILWDRDSAEMEWRDAVRILSALPHRALVILLSRAADEYLWSELFRIGGFDVVRKPLQPEDLSRAVKLAVSYWRSETSRPQTPARDSRVVVN